MSFSWKFFSSRWNTTTRCCIWNQFATRANPSEAVRRTRKFSHVFFAVFPVPQLTQNGVVVLFTHICMRPGSKLGSKCRFSRLILKLHNSSSPWLWRVHTILLIRRAADYFSIKKLDEFDVHLIFPLHCRSRHVYIVKLNYRALEDWKNIAQRMAAANSVREQNNAVKISSLDALPALMVRMCVRGWRHSPIFHLTCTKHSKFSLGCVSLAVFHRKYSSYIVLFHSEKWSL